MLKATLIGNLGADAVVRHHNGNQAIGFSVAHNEKYKDAQGVTHEKTLWINCTYWRSKDTNLLHYLKCGQLVYLEGTPSTSVYRNKNGEPTADFSLRITNLQLLGSPPDRSEDPPTATATPKHKGEPAAARSTVDLEVPDWIN